jgi:IS1 family transposase
MNKLTVEERVHLISALVAGSSIRATVVMTGVAKNTIVKLLVDLGKACSEYQDRAFRKLSCKRIQCDEIWSFCYAKGKKVLGDNHGPFEFGDVWTWTALDADTKLVPSWLVGARDAGTAHEFVQDLVDRLAHGVQLTTDGHRVQLTAVESALGANIDYAMLVKAYGDDAANDTKYSASESIISEPMAISGRPDPNHISTIFVERQNLAMRMNMRRFTQLTNGFSTRVQNHEAAVALHYMYYNFCRIRQTVRLTPAMQATVTDHVWSIEEIVKLIDSN